MDKDELIEYAIRTSEAIKEEKMPELIDYFHKKQERIEYLERSNNRREGTILEQRQEINDVKDNWNKLKEYLHNVDVVIDYSENYDGRFINYDELIDKMQEIEQGSDSNDSN